jgi:hypothetical protein
VSLTIKQKAKKSRVCPSCTTKSSQSEASPPCLTKSERTPTSPARLGSPLALRSNTALRSLHSSWRVENGINAYIQYEPQSAAYKPFDLLDVFMRMSRRCFLPRTGVLDRVWRGPCISFPPKSIATNTFARSEVSYLLFFLAEGLPLLADQLLAVTHLHVFEIAAGLAADRELHECVGGSLDLAFVLDGGPLLRVLRVQGATQLGASRICDFDLVDVVGLDPALVLCIGSLVGCVD